MNAADEPGYGPPAPYYGQQSYVRPYAKQSGLAIASMVLGICSVVFCWLGLLTLAAVVLAIVFGARALWLSAHAGAPSKAFAIAGLATGIVGGVLYLLLGGLVTAAFLLV